MLPDGYFHVTSRSVCGQALFQADADRQAFVDTLWSSARTNGWTCHAYCLMTTHYHLVVETSRPPLSRGIHRLNGVYARAFNRRHGRFGHVFSERFSATPIVREEHLFEACAYVLLNPVKAGMCDRVEDWPWSFSRFGLAAS